MAALVDTIRAALAEAAARRDLSLHDLAARTGYHRRHLRRTLYGTGWSIAVVRRLDRVLRPTLAPEVRAQLDAAYALAPTAPGRPPRPDVVRHPLRQRLAPSWHWLERVLNDTVVLVHDRGLWVEFDRPGLMDAATDPELCRVVAEVLDARIAAADVGQHGLQVARHEIAGEVVWTVALHPATRRLLDHDVVTMGKR